MDIEKYLIEVLESQNLEEDSDELKMIRKHRADVEKLIRDQFSKSSPSIRYGGSVAKGTLIKESYDLDMVCYFAHDDNQAGDSLKEIYSNVRDVLRENYYVEEKTSALRLKDKDPKNFGIDFHIDVVPGRFTDDTKTDCFIYQASAEKCRLKTNLDVHLKYVKESGVIDAIRLLKLWKARKGIMVKNFVFELLIIDLLSDKKKLSLSKQLEAVLRALSNSQDPITVKDPANPSGNDLTEILKAYWYELYSAASQTIRLIDNSGWEAVYGEVGKLQGQESIEVLRSAASAVSSPTKPWLSLCDE